MVFHVFPASFIAPCYSRVIMMRAESESSEMYGCVLVFLSNYPIVAGKMNVIIVI